MNGRIAPPQTVAFARSMIRMTEQGAQISETISRIVGANKLSNNVSVAAITRLWLEGPLRPRDLAETIALTSGGTTKVIDRLEKHGLVERRKSDGEDGRSVLVSLSPKGEQVTAAILDAVGPTLFELIDDLGEIRRASE